MTAAPTPAGHPLSGDSDAAIRRLAAAYAVAVVTHDTGLWLSLWAPRDEPSDDPLTLDTRWARRVAERWESLGTTVLHITTHLIEPTTEDRARGTVFCLAELDRPGEAFVHQSVAYADNYVRTGGEWRFASRRHLLWYGREDADPRRATLANWPQAQVGRGVDIRQELRAGRPEIGGRSE